MYKIKQNLKFSRKCKENIFDFNWLKYVVWLSRWSTYQGCQIVAFCTKNSSYFERISASKIGSNLYWLPYARLLSKDTRGPISCFCIRTHMHPLRYPPKLPCERYAVLCLVGKHLLFKLVNKMNNHKQPYRSEWFIAR